MFTVPAFAASSTFLSKAQRYYDSNCNRRNISSETSLQCYVFDKANEIQTSLDSLTSRVTTTENIDTSQDQLIIDLQNENASQAAKIANLNTKVDTIETYQNPEPTDLVFFNGPVSPSGDTSQTFDAQQYTKATFTYQGTAGAFIIQVSGDQSYWFTQYSRGEGENKSGGSVTLDSAGRYYRVIAGSTTLPPSEVYQHALGHFFN